MKPFKIIMDSFSPSKPRFSGGAPMNIASVLDSVVCLKNNDLIYFSSYRNCCSFVRTTQNDCLYLVDPNINRELLKDWINEISINFPTLEIKLLSVPYDRVRDNPYIFKGNSMEVIQARYSKKSYIVEAYLAHHLIRACFHKESIVFVKQYFEIKKVVPDLYFWNIIFLCQLGLNMYYYFWLTNKRVFHMITKEEFEKRTKQCFSNSSKEFLEYFSGEFPSEETLLLIRQLYLERRFDIIVKNLGTTRYVVPKKYARSRKNSLLRFFDTYKVLFEDEMHYYITADDYYIKKYKKTNFNVI